MSQITKDQALGIVDQVCANFAGSRQDHANLSAALQKLSTLVEPTTTDAKSDTTSTATVG